LSKDNVDLVAKNQNFGFTPCAGPEQPNERAAKQSEKIDRCRRRIRLSSGKVGLAYSPLTKAQQPSSFDPLPAGPGLRESARRLNLLEFRSP